MMNVSKELLSEVLGYAVSSIYIAPNGNFIEAQSKYRDERINIHELQHSCKEWANKNKFYIKSSMIINTASAVVEKIYEPNELNKWFHANTEPEAVFAAAQWILANKDKQ